MCIIPIECLVNEVPWPDPRHRVTEVKPNLERACRARIDKPKRSSGWNLIRLTRHSGIGALYIDRREYEQQLLDEWASNRSDRYEKFLQFHELTSVGPNMEARRGSKGTDVFRYWSRQCWGRSPSNSTEYYSCQV